MVDLTIYDVKGRMVSKLVDGYKDSGRHMVSWRADNVASGVYLYKISTGGQTIVRKCLVAR
jgi:hypothetical protein